MELSRILFGRTRGAILALLFGHADETFYLRQIVRASGYGLGPVQRELKLLTGAGIIKRTVRGRQVYFQANSDSAIFPELKSLIAKTSGVGDTLRNALSPVASLIKVAFVYGSIASGAETQRSDIDLLIVGDVSFSDVVTKLQPAQKVLGRETNPTVYSNAEFRAKLREKSHFLASVLDGPKIYLIGDENELGRLAPKRLARRA
jgi:predicted nucleotidyltransferase